MASVNIRIRVRWWVKPLIYASILPAAVIGLCQGGARGERFVAKVGEFVSRRGLVLEAD